MLTVREFYQMKKHSIASIPSYSVCTVLIKNYKKLFKKEDNTDDILEICSEFITIINIVM